MVEHGVDIVVFVIFRVVWRFDVSSAIWNYATIFDMNLPVAFVGEVMIVSDDNERDALFFIEFK